MRIVETWSKLNSTKDFRTINYGRTDKKIVARRDNDIEEWMIWKLMAGTVKMFRNLVGSWRAPETVKLERMAWQIRELLQNVIKYLRNVES